MSCKKITKKKIKIYVVIILISSLIFSYFHFFVNPQIVSTNTAKIKSYTISVINTATAEIILNNNYNDLMFITKADDGSVSLMQVNTANVNKLNNEVMTKIQNLLNQTNILNYKLPLGSFLGIPILNGIGPRVTLKIVPIGNVNTEYKSQIASLSINQSYHKIYLTVYITVCVVLPLYTQNIVVSNKMLIAENLIVGKIPSTYLNTENLTNALNLIP